MSLTTWNGHARVDYVAERSRLQITLSTTEATTEADLRRGLRAAFVIDGPLGPPAFVSAELRFGSVPNDLRGLLGAQLAEAADAVVAGPGRSRWVQLDLAELDDLSAAWAPYRSVVLAGAPDPAPIRQRLALRAVLGETAGGLWARLGVEELRAAMSAFRPPEPVFRGDPRGSDDPDGSDPSGEDAARGTWELPTALAAAGGIDPSLNWTARGRQITIVARSGPGSDPAAGLWVSFDDGTDRWRPLAPVGANELRAQLASSADPDRLPAIRIRATVAGS